MKEKKLFLKLSFIGAFIASFFNQSLLADEWFEKNFSELMRIREDLFSACPPADCIFVGVGRSPTPITAFLAASFNPKDAQKHVIDIPVSGMQRYGDLDAEAKDVVHGRFDALFGKYLPKEKIQGKRVILIDAIFSGSSLAGVFDELNRFVDSNKINAEVKGLGLNFPKEISPESIKSRGIDVTSSNLTADLLFGHIRRRFGKFEKLPITKIDPDFKYVVPQADLKVDGEYNKSVSELHEMLSKRKLTLAKFSKKSSGGLALGLSKIGQNLRKLVENCKDSLRLPMQAPTQY
ncbi:MAG: hypothetical protein KA116_01470 [Proteobacteria bacterium]|nr:hypothetical protein [Pseudomonadota bacterium]